MSEENEKKTEMELDDIELTIYQKAQDSAEHHDKLLWTVTSIMWAGNLALLGFILNNMVSLLSSHDNHYSYKVLLTLCSSLGIILMICVKKFAYQFNAIKNEKYEICKQLENNWVEGKILTPECVQHSNFDEYHEKGSQKWWYGVIAYFFLGVWVGVIFVIWSPELLSLCKNCK